jgi:hypothetical protein
MENIIFPDDTLPGFNYLDQLSEVSEDDLETAIRDWKAKYKGNDMENILTPEIE